MSAPVFDPTLQPLTGAHALEASAGTGKTYAITLLWLRLILEERLPVDSILVCTFTKAATAELRERLLAALRRARLLTSDLCRDKPPEGSAAHDGCRTDRVDVSDEDPIARIVKRLYDKDPERAYEQELAMAESAFDLAPISTIHGFCTSLIARHTLELAADPDVELIESCNDLLDLLVGDCLMQLADDAPMDVGEATAFARDVAREAGIPDEGVLRPRIIGAEAAAQAEARIRNQRQDIESLFDDRTRVSHGSTRKAGLQRLNAFCAGEVPADLPDGVTRALKTHKPSVLDDMQLLMDAARHDSRNQARCRLLDIARRSLAGQKRLAGVRTYDDLLITVRDALADPASQAALAEAVRRRYRAVIIDECQDSDGVQIDVFRRLFLNPSQRTTAAPTSSFIAIGDPKQSIYRFRGADLASYRGLIAAAHLAAPMRTNWRSDGALIAALDRCYRQQPEFADASTGAPIQYVPVEAPAHTPAVRLQDPGPFAEGVQPADCALVGLWSDSSNRYVAQHDLADQVALECRRLLGAEVCLIDRTTDRYRRLQAGDLAILASNRRQLGLVRRALTGLGIPCQQAGRGMGSVLDSDEAQDVLFWLDALSATEQGSGAELSRLLAFAATPLLGYTPTRCEALAEDPLLQTTLADRCRRQARILRQQGPLTALVRLLAETDLRTRVLSSAPGERAFTNWRHLGQLLQEQWAAGRRDPAGLVQAFGRLLADHDAAADETEMRLETDQPAVQLSTIHGSKGLEFPVVFCPFAWQVDSRQTRKNRKKVAVVRHRGGTVLDAGTQELNKHIEQELEQEDEEQQRLLYVALTRARYRCYVGLAPVDSGGSQHRNGAEASSLAALLQLPAADKSGWRAAFARCLPLLQNLLAPGCTASGNSTGAPTVRPELTEPPVVDCWRGSLWRTVSYSSLSAGDQALALTRDYDEEADGDTATRSLDPGLLDQLGSGAALGDRIHGWLEQVIGKRRCLDDILASQGGARDLYRERLDIVLDTPLWLPGVTQRRPGLAEERPGATGPLPGATGPLPAATGPLPGAPERLPTLRDLSTHAITELHFLLPVAECDPERLSQALIQDPLIRADPRRTAWARGVAAWPFSRLRGFLQGYIDLVCQWQDRWFVIDYKTNMLTDYRPATCEQAMLDHHYLLQGRLYLIALHRHLCHHLQDYDAATHLGGIGYLFVRGFPVAGCWGETPGPEAVGALDALFEPAGVWT